MLISTDMMCNRCSRKKAKIFFINISNSHWALTKILNPIGLSGTYMLMNAKLLCHQRGGEFPLGLPKVTGIAHFRSTLAIDLIAGCGGPHATKNMLVQLDEAMRPRRLWPLLLLMLLSHKCRLYWSRLPKERRELLPSR